MRPTMLRVAMAHKLRHWSPTCTPLPNVWRRLRESVGHPGISPTPTFRWPGPWLGSDAAKMLGPWAGRHSTGSWRLDETELAVDACDVLFQSEQRDSLAALGQGIWLAVTCPIDPELTIDLLGHLIDETPDEADGAAVAATTALFLADVRAQGRHRDDLMFFATQLLGTVARRHSGVKTAQELDLWMDRLELKEPEKFLVRLRNVVDVLVQDDWWFDRETFQDRMPFV